MKCFGVLIVILVSLSGCATTYKADPRLIEGFQEPEVAADKTGVYVIRGGNAWGAARGLWVAVDENVVADLSNSSHVYLELDSGLNTLHFVQATAGYGYLAIDNKPGEVVYTKFGYGTTGETEFVEKDLGQTMVMKTRANDPLEEKRPNSAYDNQLINPGMLDFPIMVEPSEEIAADATHAVVRFYRWTELAAGIAFDIWNQDGYIGSTKGRTYFSVKLEPGRHVFISRAERYAVLDANLEAGKEYAVELHVNMGWNQAHIQLLPVNLSSDSGVAEVKGWEETLTPMEVNQEVVGSEPVSKRIEKGFQFLADQRTAIDSNEEPKRDLPADFGK